MRHHSPMWILHRHFFYIITQWTVTAYVPHYSKILVLLSLQVSIRYDRTNVIDNKNRLELRALSKYNTRPSSAIAVPSISSQVGVGI